MSGPTDKIFVNGLIVRAFHGVMPHEGKVGQSFILDLSLDIDLAKAAKSDKLADTVSYDSVVKTTTAAFTGNRYQLVEAAAGAIVTAILNEFPHITAVTVTVRKPQAPVAAVFTDVGVTITRHRT
jgi:dihydroneopterin aldolase